MIGPTGSLYLYDSGKLECKAAPGFQLQLILLMFVQDQREISWWTSQLLVEN